MSDENTSPSMVERLARAVANTQGGGADEDEAALEDAAAYDDTPAIATLEEWQASIQADTRIAWLITAYPQWLAETFGARIEFRPHSNQRFVVRVDERLLQRGRFNQTDGLYIWFPDLPDDLRNTIQATLSKPGSFKRSRRYGLWGHRFIVYTEEDYRLLQEITKDMIHQPMTMAEAAHTILRKAGGGPLHLSDILQQAQAQGLIETSGQTPQLSLASVLLRDGRFNNLGKNMWVLAPSGVGDEEHEDAPALPDYTPRIYAGDEVSFWRVHFPRELWPEAQEHGIIGFRNPGKRSSILQNIAIGDRLVVYHKGGDVAGVGIVTHPYVNISETSDSRLASAHFGEEYPHRLGVMWSSELTERVRIANHLKANYPELYNHVVDPKTCVPLSRDAYTTLLSLLQIDDPLLSHLLPSIWPRLSTYLDFAQILEARSYTADELYQMAQRTAGETMYHDSDVTTFISNLQQLRLIHPTDTSTYEPQPYCAGEHTRTALARLAVLALLIPSQDTPDEYTLPARAIVPRLRDPAVTSDTFAPALGPDSPQLLAWYAEAGLVSVEGTDWQPLPDALAPLEGEDPATTMYNRFLSALLAEQEDKLADLPPIPISQQLPPVTDLETRLRELDSELIIDAQLVKRICRSLLAGRHVVLSGPPGTGKTELARRLPSLLWREEQQTFTRLMTDLNAPPVKEETEQRQGYAVELVTATEDWGVRDVVGGIGPRLDAVSGGLSYTIEHGHLTRTVLRHFAGTEQGRRPPKTQEPRRQDYRDQDGHRYRGIWLVIDEFTRAPIDAAFGSLLTTLSGGDQATLAVPTGGIERPIGLPRDFRIIGTLNSFDRHFLNEMSEALKRRFDFIDVLPPHPRHEQYEQGIAVKQALRRLHALRHSPRPTRRRTRGVAVLRGT